MSYVFNLPDLAEGTTEAQILEWLVAEGDAVEIDQDIVEVETAKAVVVIPSPTAGVVSELHGEAGAMMLVGQPLISFDVPSGDSDEADEAEAPANLVGYGPSEGGHRRRRRASVAPTGAIAVDARPLAKPPVRKLAKELGVDLGTVAGTGSGGIITRADVELACSPETNSALATPAPVAPTPVPSPAPTAAPTAAPSPTPIPAPTLASAAAAPQARPASIEPATTNNDRTVTPVTGIRRTIAKKMEQAHAIPAASAWLDADATGLMRLRSSLKKSHPEAGVTPMAIIMFLTAKALEHVPVLNSHYVDDQIITFSDVHLGFAASTDRGLLVPSVKNADKASIIEISLELRRLTQAARDGKVTPAELGGSTFTISNYGSLGMDGGIPLLNPPNTGILGVSSIKDQAMVEDGAVVIQPTVNLSLSFDHRVCDGAEASEFLTFLAQAVADPAVLLL